MSSDRLRLFHLSDIHFGLEDRDALAWVRDEIAAKRPAAVVITGDHTMRARHHEFAAATRWITALDVPVTISIGLARVDPADTLTRALVKADQALYEAKHNGKDRFRAVDCPAERTYPPAGRRILNCAPPSADCATVNVPPCPSCYPHCCWS